MSIPSNFPFYVSMFKIMKNTQIMLKDRGYIIPSSDEFPNPEALYNFVAQNDNRNRMLGEDEKSKQYTLGPRSILNRIYYRATNNILNQLYPDFKTVFVYWMDFPPEASKTKTINKNLAVQAKTTFNDVRAVYPGVDHFGNQINVVETINYMMIISQAVLNSPAMNSINEVRGKFIDIFLYNELLFLKTKGMLVNKFEIMTPDQVKTELPLAHISKLKTIARDDPQVKYWGARPGQIFRIIRDDRGISNSLGDFSLEYRRVIGKNIESKRIFEKRKRNKAEGEEEDGD